MNHRTYGETKDCKGCRYWSEMLARTDSEMPGVVAMCLNYGKEKDNKYTEHNDTCKDWESGHLGAIDSPGQDPLIYEIEEGSNEA